MASVVCSLDGDGMVQIARKTVTESVGKGCQDTSAAVVQLGAAASAAAGVPEVPRLEDLLQQLRDVFEREKAQGITLGSQQHQQQPESFKRMNDGVQGLLRAYAASNSLDWQKYALFNDLHYVRNLVEANDDFELIVLCWKTGQVSRVHNHADSHCWLAVLGGEMREVQYQQAPAPPAVHGAAVPEDAAYVEATHSTEMRVGDCGYINDFLALHTVGCYGPEAERCRSEGGAGPYVPQGGVTLHLYAPPIKRVKIYDNDTVTERIPGFYSKGGVRV
ncbi:Cysteine dioxygenase type 1 [Tetrabaena socialis]|uniref:Cysteine dioxygenase n=1 Tax=Tetrabaena socialis TaxID=47790 RepID=A0A2J7ZJT9_9CHLO|nr:Cysteine dioxygenase type 1 [Tetrabaena socialis]|eukprot:PNH00535.1 Cysteine dioxygenase type 1 [Tetrabaena socialis]